MFPIVADPVAAGFVDSLARPGGNVTGFMTAEYGTAGKWLELLKEIAPRMTRAAIFRDPGIITGASQFAAIQAVSSYLKVEVSPIPVHDASKIERDVGDFARVPGGGLVVTSGPGPQRHRDLIVRLAAQYKLPTVYPEHFYVAAGGLISYGVDYLDQCRRAAGYVDRILKGDKPADLPVQAPTKLNAIHSQDRQGARPRRATDAARTRRRGDRIDLALLRPLTSPPGPTRSPLVPSDFRLLGYLRTCFAHC